MMADAVPPQFQTWSHSEGREPVRPTRAECLERLEALRARVHRWLDRLEGMACEQLVALSSSAEAEGPSNQRADEPRTQLRNEVEHWEQMRQAQLDELEHDRRLLAEAWERLERERAEARTERWAGPNTQPASVHPPTVRLASHTGDSNSPVSQAILRQFEALRRDVRRTAETRRPG